MRTCVLLLLTAAFTFAAGEGGPRFERLEPRARRAIPHYRVAVGQDTPWRLRGRSTPVRFETREGVLYADADLSEGCEAPIRSGEAQVIALDDGTDRGAAFFAGSPEQGEPEWSVVILDVLVVRGGRGDVRFFDQDADGTFFTPYRDFLTMGRAGEFQPVAPVVVLGGEAFRLTADESAGRASLEPDPAFPDRSVFPDFRNVAGGLRHVNEIRAGMNLPPLALDREASRQTLLHLRYCERVGGNTHIEEEGNPAYTREGAAAGLNSIGWIGGGGVTSAIDGHMGSLLHRMELIDPRVTAIGIAASGNRVWIHTECGPRRPWQGQGPVIFPGPDRRWTSGAYSGDNPDPRPEPAAGAGLPVTVAWYGEDEGIRDVRAELRDARGPVECFRNDSRSRELATNHAALRAALLPRGSLSGGLLRLTWEQAGRPCRLDYAFSIGRR